MKRPVWTVKADGRKVGKALTEATARRMARAYEDINGKGATVVAPGKEK